MVRLHAVRLMIQAVTEFTFPQQVPQRLQHMLASECMESTVIAEVPRGAILPNSVQDPGASSSGPVDLKVACAYRTNNLIS